MSEIDVKQMMTDMVAQLESEGVPIEGMSLEDLRDAVSNPKAIDEIARLMDVEASSVAQGDAAPDFCLPYLSADRAGQSQRQRLSQHFGTRPVALIFGSYT